MGQALRRLNFNVQPRTRPDAFKLERGCTRKKKYPTEKAAWGAIRRIKNNRADTNPARPLKPYECEFCFHYHVGHAKTSAHSCR